VIFIVDVVSFLYCYQIIRNAQILKYYLHFVYNIIAMSIASLSLVDRPSFFVVSRISTHQIFRCLANLL